MMQVGVLVNGEDRHSREYVNAVTAVLLHLSTLNGHLPRLSLIRFLCLNLAVVAVVGRSVTEQLPSQPSFIYLIDR